MKKLRIGIIGLGMGGAHADHYLTHPAAEIAAIADPDTNRLNKTGEKHRAAARYTDGMAMLKKEKLDVVSVATPNKFHMPYTLAALRAGAHVLCEKPMAMNAAEARKMLAAARQARRKLMINFSFRFTPQSWALKKQADTGILGNIYFARSVWHRRRGLPGFGGWFGQKALAGGGPLIDLGVHRLDLALWLMGHPKPVWVMAGAYNPIGARLAREQKKKFDVEDLAAGMIRFSNGATLILEASWAANIRERELMETRLLGDKGGLVQRNIGEGYEFEAELYVEREGCQFDMKLHPPVPDAKSAMAHFLDSIVSNKPHTATGEEGLVVMELLDALYASAKTGRPLKIA